MLKNIMSSKSFLTFLIMVSVFSFLPLKGASIGAGNIGCIKCHRDLGRLKANLEKQPLPPNELYVPSYG